MIDQKGALQQAVKPTRLQFGHKDPFWTQKGW